MKKYLFAIMAIATTFASCSNDDILVEETQESNGSAISFQTFTDKMTRADANNSTKLQDFYTTFKVYGWKKIGDNWQAVFDNETNEYFSEDKAGEEIFKSAKPSTEWGSSLAAGWYYEYIKFWDKMASAYQFDAYTPITLSGAVTCTSDGVITYGLSSSKVTVDGKNLMATPAAALAYKGFSTDFMTATSQSNNRTQDVSLTFNHELAKLNVKLVADPDTKTAQTITVKTVEILNLASKSYYDSSKESEDGYLTGWATPILTEGEATYKAKDDLEIHSSTVTSYRNYVIEQLMIPQVATKAATASSISEFDQPCMHVKYTVGTEEFEGYYGLANLFGDGTEDLQLKGGNQYTITVTVGPNPIHFAATVNAWADNNASWSDK